MKKLILALIALLVAVPAYASMYYNSDGSYAGQSIDTGSTTHYYGSDGSYKGSAIDTN